MFHNDKNCELFIEKLCSLHPALNYTSEQESNNQLAFLVVLVHKRNGQFLTSIYRKATFTGLYTRFDSFSSHREKISLVKCLIKRTHRLSSKEFMESDLNSLKKIFLSNEYPERLLDKVFLSTNIERNKPFGPAKCPVFLKLPWMGKASNDIEKETKNITEGLFFACNVVFIFSKRTILPPTPKESLPAQISSNVVYEFKCECDARYEGRTSQRLSDRIKQHVPASIRNKTVPSRQQPKRGCKSENPVLCDSAIGKHLLSNTRCANSYSDHNFKIIKKCRSLFQLRVMESVVIKLTNPVLCRQKDYVFNLSLF